MNISTDLERFLLPKSVAIIGASATQGKAGYNFINNLVSSNFAGSIYPVNPREESILGLKTYSSIIDIPGEVDLAVPIVNPSLIPDIVSQCAEKGVKAIMISSPGFADAGAEGERLQTEILTIARERGIRIMGPNTQGIINMDTGLVAISVDPVEELVDGKGVSFICHSGWFYSDWLLQCPLIGLNKMIDLGNMSDVDEVEALEYLGADPQTRVIVLHIEGVRDGRRFLEVAGEVARKKPVIALKVGRSVAGVRAIASHTGSLAGSDAIHDISFQQAGIIRALDMDEVVDFTKLFACLAPLPNGKCVGMVTFTGTGGVLAADACDEFDLSLAHLSKSSMMKLKDVIPSWASVENPLDLGRVIDPEVFARGYPTALEVFAEDQNVNAILVMAMTISAQQELSTFTVLREYAERGVRKPTVVTGLRDDEGLKQLRSLELKGLVTFPTVRRSVRALAKARARHNFLNQL